MLASRIPYLIVRQQTVLGRTDSLREGAMEETPHPLFALPFSVQTAAALQKIRIAYRRKAAPSLAQLSRLSVLPLILARPWLPTTHRQAIAEPLPAFPRQARHSLSARRQSPARQRTAPVPLWLPAPST